MKKSIIIIMVCLFFATKLIVQEEVSVEKSIFGIQVGTMGIWVNNEIKLANTIALRSEAGFEITNWRIGNTFYRRGDRDIYVPLVLTIEPRYYFELKKRHSKGLSIANNSAAFLSIKINHPYST